MKLDSYTISKIEDQVAKFLFIKWLKGSLKDCKDHEIQDLYDMYHEILARQVNVID